MNCEVCADKRSLGLATMNKLLQKTLALTHAKFNGDDLWTQNALSHILWKLSAYGKALNQDEFKYLKPVNVMHHLTLAYKKEFTEGKRSFFQRVVEKDTPAQSHFVAVVGAIRRIDNIKTAITFSDGQYCLASTVRESDDLQSTDGQICRLIKTLKFHPGLKIRFVNQALITQPGKEVDESLTNHFFLQQTGRHELSLNFNGMCIADAGA